MADGGLKGVPERRSSRGDQAPFGLLAESRPESFEIGPEKANIAAHDAKVGNLFPFYPKVDGL